MKTSFEVENFCIFIRRNGNGACIIEATVKVLVDGKPAIAVAEADGPMSALSLALGLALKSLYPNLNMVGVYNDGWLNAICSHWGRLLAGYDEQIRGWAKEQRGGGFGKA